MSRRILHPCDLSRASGAAFKKVVEMAKSNQGELMLVHLVSPVVPMAGDGYVSPKMYGEMAASNRAWAQKELNKLVAKAKTSGVHAKTAMLEGTARSLGHREAVPRQRCRTRRGGRLVPGADGAGQVTASVERSTPWT
jgi:nucleotide-binding universal stress UspA family protein